MRTNPLLAIFLLLAAPAAHARPEEPAPAPGTVYKAVTVIDDFKDLGVDGTLKRPGVAGVVERREGSYPPGFRLRADWDAEIEESVKHVK